MKHQGWIKTRNGADHDIGLRRIIDIKRHGPADVKDGDFLKLIDAGSDRIPWQRGTTAHLGMRRLAGIKTGDGAGESRTLFIFRDLTCSRNDAECWISPANSCAN